ncbi:uncharacterized protein L3040_005882 [Drepanopeziza brunnea f. sp. 'multigermtubi']|uniref:Glycosyltransferase family 31 protein n=1 Tax=Marssonina brunnea f. sp. multigermtubi (strain MB_m1) TaxID=1072389 RepID=K1WTV3_MARBU|nr:uncharacterized protein MBM_09876 [Drepanopeziza brunnea f. sp. 'multigermtubi' MB_m1]EKD12013.1 hypothetical protein MBM_09876 [Drepanopeziza brunnea f. sp. 'multigermtubi' MB_m1]KAJ5040220.1 hypothetical protein L3040_005882 [Drepanopeziza brunnea f. sp. 'multigermtubi']
MLPRTPLQRWLAAAAGLFVVFWFWPNFADFASLSDSSFGSSFTTSGSHGGADDLSFVKQALKDHKIGPDIEYASRTIRYVPDQTERKSITEIDDNLFPDSFSNITISKMASLPAGRVVNVHIKQSPRPDQIDASEMLFAASTTYARFKDQKTSPLKEWKRWLTDGNGHSNGAGVILALFETSDGDLVAAAETLESAGINATVVHSNPDLNMAGRYVDLVHKLYNHPTRPHRKYLVLMDDDTFFPRMHDFQEHLSQYNPENPFYIGTFTERADWFLRNRAPFAYGGGGIILTAPTAEKVVSLPCLDKEEGKMGGFVWDSDQGDRLLYNCLSNLTDISLTYMPTLHQADQFGDPSGVYESGHTMHSIHHFKSWHRFIPDQMHVVSDACGEACVLQRFQFKDNYIVTNGYSVAHYPQGIDFDPLQMEHTFSAGGHGEKEPDLEDVTFNMFYGSLRKNLAHTGKKKGWQLLAARKEGDGRVKQVYFKSWGDDRWIGPGEKIPAKEDGPRDSIAVLTWIP